MKCGHLLLRDTRGNFYLGVKLPSREYRPTDAHHRAQKKWRDNKNNKEHFNKWRRNWRKNLPAHKKEQYRLQKNAYMLEYYRRNRDSIIAYQKQHRKKKLVNNSPKSETKSIKHVRKNA